MSSGICLLVSILHFVRSTPVTTPVCREAYAVDHTVATVGRRSFCEEGLDDWVAVQVRAPTVPAARQHLLG